MRPSLARWTAGAAVATALVTALAGCSSAPAGDTAAASPVALRVADAPKDLTVGVVVSLSSPAGEGSQWKGAAEGAGLAAWRLQQGDTPITLTTVDDKGTAAGAEAAVASLVEADVSAIVFATSGSHLSGALAAAGQAGVPALLPYGWEQTDLPAGVWITGTSPEALATATGAALARLGATHPVTVTTEPAATNGGAGAGSTGGAAAAVGTTITVAPGTTAAALTATLAKQLKDSKADAVLVNGDAAGQALVAAACQGTGLPLPLVFTPDALSPAFPAALTTGAASLDGDFWTVGPATDDGTALAATPDGQAVSAFLAADRRAATDPDTHSLIGDQPFSAVAAFADAPSHDAVIAVAVAAATARSARPADITAALATLTVDHADGVVGPPLTFATPHALPADTVTVLHASTQDAGLRPRSSTTVSGLDWFASPAS